MPMTFYQKVATAARIENEDRRNQKAFTAARDSARAQKRFARDMAEWVEADRLERRAEILLRS